MSPSTFSEHPTWGKVEDNSSSKIRRAFPVCAVAPFHSGLLKRLKPMKRNPQLIHLVRKFFRSAIVVNNEMCEFYLFG